MLSALAQTGFVTSLHGSSASTLAEDPGTNEHLPITQIGNIHGSATPLLQDNPHVRQLIRSIVAGPQIELPRITEYRANGMSEADILNALHDGALHLGTLPSAAPHRAPLPATTTPRPAMTWVIPIDTQAPKKGRPDVPGTMDRPQSKASPTQACIDTPPPPPTHTSSTRALTSNAVPMSRSGHIADSTVRATPPPRLTRSISAPVRSTSPKPPMLTPKARACSVPTSLPTILEETRHKPSAGSHATRINNAMAKLTTQCVQHKRPELTRAVQALRRDGQISPATAKAQLELILSINKETGMRSGLALREVREALEIVSRRNVGPLVRGTMPCNVIESFADDLKRLHIHRAVNEVLSHAVSRSSSMSLTGRPAQTTHTAH